MPQVKRQTSINFLHYSKLDFFTHPRSFISPLSSTFNHFHQYFLILSTTVINFSPLLSTEVYSHVRVTPIKSGKSQWPASLLERLVLLKVKTFETYLWRQFANLPICQYNIWSCHSIEFPGFLHFSRALIDWLFLQRWVRYFPDKTKHWQRHNEPRLFSYFMYCQFGNQVASLAWSLFCRLIFLNDSLFGKQYFRYDDRNFMK